MLIPVLICYIYLHDVFQHWRSLEYWNPWYSVVVPLFYYHCRFSCPLSCCNIQYWCPYLHLKFQFSLLAFYQLLILLLVVPIFFTLYCLRICFSLLIFQDLTSLVLWRHDLLTFVIVTVFCQKLLIIRKQYAAKIDPVIRWQYLGHHTPHQNVKETVKVTNQCHDHK